MRYIVLLVVALSLLAEHCSAQKVTVDPNTAVAKVEEPEEKTDSRLAQKITYDAKRKSVLAILADLGEKTGVTFKAGYNSQDWQVRDRKMNIFAKDVTLASLMNSIARVMKFKWSIETKDEVTNYRLIMDRKTIMEAEARKQQEEERAARQMYERRKNALDELTRVADLTPAELAQLKNDNPFMYLIAQAGIAKPLTSLLSESPAILDALGSGKALSLDGGSLSPAAQQALTATMAGTHKLERIFEGGRREFPDDFLANIGQAQVQINRDYERQASMMGFSPFLGDIRVQYGDQHFELPLFDPNGKLAQAMGKALLSVMDLPEDQRKDQLNSTEQEMMRAVMSDMKSLTQADKPVEHPDDPELHAKIKMDGGQVLADVEEALAKAAKMSVVSDNFGSRTMLGRFAGGEAELITLLEQIETSYRYDWEKHGRTLEFRDKKWFEKREAQIPDAWVEGWKNTLKKTGTLDLKDLAQIACLTDEQVRTNIDEDPVLGNIGARGLMYEARDMLRLYAAIGDDQRKALFTPMGLDLGTLAPDQLQTATKFIRSRNALFMRGTGAKVVITAERKQKEDDLVRYVFTVTTDEGPGPLKWTIDAPVYREPAKQKQEAQPKSDPPNAQH